MKRLFSLDFLRGIMIFVMVTYHALVYCVFQGIENALAVIPSTVMPFLLPLLLLLTWAAFFALISGIATAYTMVHNLLTGKEPLKEIVKVALIRGLVILVLHYFYLGIIGHFQRNLDGEPVRSLLIGSIERGYFSMFDYEILFYTDALLMTSLSGIGVSFFLGILCRKFHRGQIKKIVLVIWSVGCAWILLSPSIQSVLVPRFPEALEAKRYLLAMLLSWLIGPRHCLFPYFGFALFGGGFGVILAQIANTNQKTSIRRQIIQYGFSTSLFFLTIAGSMAIANGMPELTTDLLPFTMYTLNLGLMIVLTTIIVVQIDLGREEKCMKMARFTRPWRRFGLMTLSMYLFESVLALLLVKIFMPLFNNELQTSLWVILSGLWEKVKFAMGFEWFTDKVLLKLCNHKSSRLLPEQSLDCLQIDETE